MISFHQGHIHVVCSITHFLNCKSNICFVLASPLSLLLSLSPPLSSQNAPPPVPSSHTHQAAVKKPSPSVSQATHGVASMSVTDKTQQYKVNLHCNTTMLPMYNLMYVALQEPATEGTVKDHANFNAETDAKTLRDAMKGFGNWIHVKWCLHGCIVYLCCYYTCTCSNCYQIVAVVTINLINLLKALCHDISSNYY